MKNPRSSKSPETEEAGASPLATKPDPFFRARYGKLSKEDAALLREMIEASIVGRRASDSDFATTLGRVGAAYVMLSEHDKTGIERDRAFTRFFEKCLNALENCDASFFRKLAKLTESKLNDAAMDRPAWFALQALQELRKAKPNQKPEKHAVRKMTMDLAAFGRLSSKYPAMIGGETRYYPATYLRSLTGDNVAGLLGLTTRRFSTEFAAAREMLATTDWTALWKRLGIAHFPKGTGGQPFRKARKGEI